MVDFMYHYIIHEMGVMQSQVRRWYTCPRDLGIVFKIMYNHQHSLNAIPSEKVVYLLS